MVVPIPPEQVKPEHRGYIPARAATPIPEPRYLESIQDAADLLPEELEWAGPTPEQLEPLKDYERYWEPIKAGMEIKIYPRYPAIPSSSYGVWECRNLHEVEVVREHLKAYTGGNPDLLKIDNAEWAKMQKKPDEWFQCESCPVRSYSNLAMKLHSKRWKHTFQ